MYITANVYVVCAWLLGVPPSVCWLAKTGMYILFTPSIRSSCLRPASILSCVPSPNSISQGTGSAPCRHGMAAADHVCNRKKFGIWVWPSSRRFLSVSLYKSTQKRTGTCKLSWLSNMSCGFPIWRVAKEPYCDQVDSRGMGINHSLGRHLFSY